MMVSSWLCLEGIQSTAFCSHLLFGRKIPYESRFVYRAPYVLYINRLESHVGRGVDVAHLNDLNHGGY